MEDSAVSSAGVSCIPIRAQSAGPNYRRNRKGATIPLRPRSALPSTSRVIDPISAVYPREFSLYFGPGVGKSTSPCPGPLFTDTPIIPSYIPRSCTPSSSYYTPKHAAIFPTTKTPLIARGTRSRSEWIDSSSTDTPGPGSYSHSLPKTKSEHRIAFTKRTSQYLHHSACQPHLTSVALDQPLWKEASPGPYEVKVLSQGPATQISIYPRVGTLGRDISLLVDQEPIRNKYRALFCRLLEAFDSPNVMDLDNVDGNHPPPGLPYKCKSFPKNVFVRRRHGRAVEAMQLYKPTNGTNGTTANEVNTDDVQSDSTLFECERSYGCQ